MPAASPAAAPGGPYRVSLGGMQLRGWRAFPRTVLRAYRALAAARKAPGCVHAELFRRGRLYFALSVWRSEAEMQAYARGAAHGPLMPLAGSLMKSFRNESWDSDTMPDRDAALARWQALGRGAPLATAQRRD